jgi:hypothetical protein
VTHHHVTSPRDDPGPDVAQALRPFGHVGRRRQLGRLSLEQQDRAANRPPVLPPLLEAERIRPPGHVHRVVLEGATAGDRQGAVLGQEMGHAGRAEGIELPDARGACLEVGQRSPATLSRAPDPVDPVHRAARKVLVGFFRQAHPLHHHDPPGSLREDPREERRDGAAHGMAQQDQLLPGDRVHQVGDVVQVVHEVVVAAGPDPLGVAVSAQVRGDQVVPGGGECRGDGREAPGEVEEAVWPFPSHSSTL